MDDNNKDDLKTQEPNTIAGTSLPGDYLVMTQAARELHAQIRLITASDFCAFLDLTRQEQLDALRSLLSCSTRLTDLFDQD